LNSKVAQDSHSILEVENIGAASDDVLVLVSACQSSTYCKDVIYHRHDDKDSIPTSSLSKAILFDIKSVSTEKMFA